MNTTYVFIKNKGNMLSGKNYLIGDFIDKFIPGTDVPNGLVYELLKTGHIIPLAEYREKRIDEIFADSEIDGGNAK